MGTWKKVLTEADKSTLGNSLTNADTGLVVGSQVVNWVNAQGYGTGAGDITEVNTNSGSGLSGGAASGAVTLSIDYLGTDNFINTRTAVTAAIDAGDFILYHDGTDGDVKKGAVSYLPFTNNTGTVTSVSVVSSNGFAGTLTNASTTPAITLTTTITGVLKGNGTAISAATAGTDYMAPSSTINLGTSNFALNRSSAAQTLNDVSITGNATTATTATKSTNLAGGNNTTLLGSIPYQSHADTTTLLSPNTTTTKNFLSQTGTGTNGAAPTWSTVSKTDVGLSNVENTALSTWTGSSNITTIGAATAVSLVVTGDLTVNGSTTSISTTHLLVEDKIITLADTGSPTTTTGSVSGIQIETSATAAEWPEFIWTNGGKLTGWTVSNHTTTATVDYPVAIMEFSASTAPTTGDAAGLGSFYFVESTGALYIRTA
jgi:hypothetical protein